MNTNLRINLKAIIPNLKMSLRKMKKWNLQINQKLVSGSQQWALRMIWIMENLASKVGKTLRFRIQFCHLTDRRRDRQSLNLQKNMTCLISFSLVESWASFARLKVPRILRNNYLKYWKLSSLRRLFHLWSLLVPETKIEENYSLVLLGQPLDLMLLFSTLVLPLELRNIA